MRVTIDHIGIAVSSLDDALAFYRDALGLDVEAPEEVPSQRVRAHFIPLGRARIELLEATADDSPIAKYVAKRGPGLHHITLRVDDIAAALAQLKARGVRLIDDDAAGGGARFARRVHPPVERARSARRAEAGAQLRLALSERRRSSSFPHPLDGFFRLDGGAMFGVVPKPLWERRAAADEKNRILLGLRPLLVRGARTMIIDAGIGDKMDAEGAARSTASIAPGIWRCVAGRGGLTAADIEIVLASHLHFDHAGGFTKRDGSGTLVPRVSERPVRRAHAPSGRTPRIRTSATGPAICPRTSSR